MNSTTEIESAFSSEESLHDGSLSCAEIPEGSSCIPDWNFMNNDSIVSVRFPNTIKYAGEGAFYECKNLKSVYLNEGLLSLGDCCFYRCCNLSSIHLPSSLTSIGNSVFACCQNLKYVTYDNSSKIRNKILQNLLDI